jgi:acetylornithine aminotransferase
MTAALRQKQLLVVPAGENVLRLLPPLTITEDEIEQAYHIMDEAFSHLATA